MDAKRLEKEKKVFKEETKKYRDEMLSRDRATFSEKKTYSVDYGKGELVHNKEK